jgi:hypothetical protein
MAASSLVLEAVSTLNPYTEKPSRALVSAKSFEQIT